MSVVVSSEAESKYRGSNDSPSPAPDTPGRRTRVTTQATSGASQATAPDTPGPRTIENLEFSTHWHIPSPHSRFEPQFDSLAEEPEEMDQEDRRAGNEHENGTELAENENQSWKAEDPRWNEESDQLISDMISQIQSNSCKTRERTISSEVYQPSQTGKRRRLISGNGTTSPDKPVFQFVSHVRPVSDPDHSHQMSVQAFPQLTHQESLSGPIWPTVRRSQGSIGRLPARPQRGASSILPDQMGRGTSGLV
ncbi:hypothetical protein PGT21_005228 [Puccinia graminis f. sp. tritici]|uniref:Uncharacterized protein n=2 Tax=Puccinia graminis f. sp. tritici TaxID=56615 RepID=E3KB78_PUCGT|nr:uncharacterized protein PGTG_07840 [Puccinia graminis f. sp. tritici CRL 75-36-700-3]EFP81591.2 hypothetical protein PGTG_07840 [Puccinia graminis f. sp. tritici CRL 75-36-700-3]KAA1109974.1 hypothetical protein PGT21_005228 [Puccinia graminis f. sp. tritici]